METTKRTPGEWEVYFDMDSRPIILNDTDAVVCKMAKGDMAKPDAAFICKSVNSHDKLVESLMELVAQLDNEHLSEYCDPIIEKAKAAIQKATA